MKFKTPPVSGKFIATLPPLLSVGIIALLVYRFHLEKLAIPLVLGVIAGGLVDLDNALSGRLKNTAVSLAAFAASSLSVQASLGNTALFLPVMALLAFVFTMIGAVGLRYRTIAFGTLAVAVYTTLTYNPDSASAWYLNPLMILCGAGLYSLITLGLHILLPHRPVQESVANAYTALGGYLDAKACFFDPDEADGIEERQIALAMKNNQVIHHFNLCRSALFYRMRGQHRHPRTTRMLRYYFAAQDIHERASSSHISYRQMADKLKNSDLIFRFLRLMELQGQACRDIADSLREGRTYTLTPASPAPAKGSNSPPPTTPPNTPPHPKCPCCNVWPTTCKTSTTSLPTSTAVYPKPPPATCASPTTTRPNSKTPPKASSPSSTPAPPPSATPYAWR